MSSYVKSSALRLFEKILEETRNKFKSISGVSSPLMKLVETWLAWEIEYSLE